MVDTPDTLWMDGNYSTSSALNIVSHSAFLPSLRSHPAHDPCPQKTKSSHRRSSSRLILASQSCGVAPVQDPFSAIT